MWAILAFLIGLVIVALGIGMFLKMKREKKEVDYKSLYTMGLVWIPFGVVFMPIDQMLGVVFLLMGIVYLTVGIAGKGTEGTRRVVTRRPARRKTTSRRKSTRRKTTRRKK